MKYSNEQPYNSRGATGVLRGAAAASRVTNPLRTRSRVTEGAQVTGTLVEAVTCALLAV